MEQKKEVRNKWLHLRLNNQEYHVLHNHWQQSTHRELSDYARRVLLKKPVRINYRNASADELLAAMIRLKGELEVVGKSWQEAVEQLRRLDQTPQVQLWLITQENLRRALLQKVEDIRLQMVQINAQWLPK